MLRFSTGNVYLRTDRVLVLFGKWKVLPLKKDLNIVFKNNFSYNQGYNDKVWADLPETCKELPQTKCLPVEKFKVVKEKFTKCDKEPYQDCKKVPEEKCIPVQKERCQDEPYQDCHDETSEECEEKHLQVNKN